MEKPTSTHSAEHYSWGEGCDGWHLVKQPSLSVIQERMPAGTKERRHYHGSARQFFYVLSGHATMEVEGIVSVLAPGQGLEVAPRDAHQIRNETNAVLDFLVISEPPSHGDRTDAER